MYYIITNGKYWVIENPIRPGEYMESTKSSNAKQFTFKQAKNLLNARSKKLGWKFQPSFLFEMFSELLWFS